MMATTDRGDRANPRSDRGNVARGLVSVLAVTVFGVLLRPVGSDLWWGFTHHWTAAANGERVRLPFGWRQQETPAGTHTIDLRNALRGALVFRSPDRISVRELQTRFDPEEMVVRWQRLQTRFLIPGDRLEPTPNNWFLRDHYRCPEVKRSADGRVHLTCFDRGGRWVVSVEGGAHGIADLSQIAQELPQRSREEQ
jgi:hypothetical protein